MDIAGLDVLGHVVGNLRVRLGDDPGSDVVGPTFRRPHDRARHDRRESWSGLLQREKDASGESQILTLDPATLTYRPRQHPRLPSIRRGGVNHRRSRARAHAVRSLDKAGRFLRDTLAPTLVYTAMVAPSIAHSPDDVDRVMRWGFGWEWGLSS